MLLKKKHPQTKFLKHSWNQDFWKFLSISINHVRWLKLILKIKKCSTWIQLLWNTNYLLGYQHVLRGKNLIYIMGTGLCQPCSGNKLTLRSTNNQWLPNIFLNSLKKFTPEKIFSWVNDSCDWKCAATYATNIWCHTSRRSFMQTSFCMIVSVFIISKITCCYHSVSLKFKVVEQLTFTQLNFSSLVEWWEEGVEHAIPALSAGTPWDSWHSPQLSQEWWSQLDNTCGLGQLHQDHLGALLYLVVEMSLWGKFCP